MIFLTGSDQGRVNLFVPMKTNNPLKAIRVLLALLIFIPIFLYFIDFADRLPDGVVSQLLRIQLVPAILAGAIICLSLLLIITWLFGRVYCSVLCPLGILQDVINRISNLFRKPKKRKRRYKYSKPQNILRYSILTLTVLVSIFVSNTLLLVLDPYSNFGRIGANLFRPAVMEVNNLLADGLARMDNYTLYHVTLSTVTWSAFLFALGFLVLLIILVVWRGRLFCNTLCPVGALLGLVSKYSLFRITINETSCNMCGSCARICKTQAISSKEKTVDASRCVDCFNCLSACPNGGIGYTINPIYRRKAVQPMIEDTTAVCEESRRTFLATGVALASSMPLLSYAQRRKRMRMGHAGNHPSHNGIPVTPPGSLSIERFKDQCTACHLCVVHCPTQILKPSGMQYGFDYFLKPHMSYEAHFCNYECTVCSEVCPTKAIAPITSEEKATIQIGIAHFIKRLCIVHSEGTDCGACSEHCPTQAVHMVPYKGTLTIPQVDPELCIGCGGCESICPVRPDRAIVVISNPVHQQAEKPEEGETKEVEIDDFGF